MLLKDVSAERSQPRSCRLTRRFATIEMTAEYRELERVSAVIFNVRGLHNRTKRRAYLDMSEVSTNAALSYFKKHIGSTPSDEGGKVSGKVK